MSTALGAYGFGTIDGENLLLADDPDGFARAVGLALRNSSVREGTIQQGAARARALSWSTIEKDFGNHLIRTAVRACY